MGFVDAVARRVVEQKVAPLASAGCAIRRGGSWTVELGGATGVYFDLASITKPMTAVASLAAGLPLGAPLGSVLQEARGTASENATIAALLSHRARLDGHRPIYAPLLTSGTYGKVPLAQAIRIAAEARIAEELSPPGHGEALYSDLGYILVGAALSCRTGSEDAGEAIERWVLSPLGLEKEAGTARSLSAHGVDLKEIAAPTEEVAWRGGLIRGVVHDENAWAIAGHGGCGHAGIFGTVASVIAFGCAVQDALDGLLSPFGPIDLSPLVAEQPGGTLRAGWDGKSPTGSSAGIHFGPRSFGHLGFTGTSLWIDPDAKIVSVLLTNRVCPTRTNLGIKTARPEVNDALFLHAMTL